MEETCVAKYNKQQDHERDSSDNQLCTPQDKEQLSDA
jgi:hypothetical protein